MSLRSLTPRDAVLYYAHASSPVVRREVLRLRAALDAAFDIFVVGYCRSADDLRGIDEVAAVAYTEADLRGLPYPGKLDRFRADDYIGNTDLVPMRFFRDRPGYDRYWIVEYDVRFGGDWAELFADLASSDADLLGTAVQTWSENPGWAHWDTLSTAADSVPTTHRVKAFLPFARISRRLLESCDARYRHGWSGHPEVLWPTVATVSGLRVEDIGGDGTFVPASRRGRYYQNTRAHWSLFPGTFVYRPCFLDRDLGGKDTRFPGVLWHPVKDAG